MVLETHAEDAVTIDDLHVRRARRVVFDGLSLRLPRGQVIGLLGPSALLPGWDVWGPLLIVVAFAVGGARARSAHAASPHPVAVVHCQLR